MPIHTSEDIFGRISDRRQEIHVDQGSLLTDRCFHFSLPTRMLSIQMTCQIRIPLLLVLQNVVVADITSVLVWIGIRHLKEEICNLLSLAVGSTFNWGNHYRIHLCAGHMLADAVAAAGRFSLSLLCVVCGLWCVGRKSPFSFHGLYICHMKPTKKQEKQNDSGAAALLVHWGQLSGDMGLWTARGAAFLRFFF